MPRGDNRRGNGRGLWGPAKGEGSPLKSIQTAPPLNGAESNPGGQPGFRALSRQQRLDACKDVWWSVMTSAAEPATARIIAADKFYDREAGKAPQTNINLTGDEFERLSERELADEQARVDEALAQAAARAAQKDDTGQSDDVVH